MPEQDVELYQEQFAAADHHACRSCGHVVRGRDVPGDCPLCCARHWSPAVRAVCLSDFKSRDELASQERTRESASRERERNQERNEAGQPRHDGRRELDHPAGTNGHSSHR
jgi:hypothetical protein